VVQGAARRKPEHGPEQREGRGSPLFGMDADSGHPQAGGHVDPRCDARHSDEQDRDPAGKQQRAVSREPPDARSARWASQHGRFAQPAGRRCRPGQADGRDPPASEWRRGGIQRQRADDRILGQRERGPNRRHPLQSGHGFAVAQQDGDGHEHHRFRLAAAAGTGGQAICRVPEGRVQEAVGAGFAARRPERGHPACAASGSRSIPRTGKAITT
jgi:hypothetical protein